MWVCVCVSARAHACVRLCVCVRERAISELSRTSFGANWDGTKWRDLQGAIQGLTADTSLSVSAECWWGSDAVSLDLYRQPCVSSLQLQFCFSSKPWSASHTHRQVLQHFLRHHTHAATIYAKLDSEVYINRCTKLAILRACAAEQNQD